MEFKQLEAYLKLVDLGSFSKAGDALFLSQPSISHYVNALEKELKTKLIIRTTKTVRPTKNGRMFYEYAKNILALKEKAAFSVQRRSHSCSGEIEILASSVPAQYILPEVIVEFNKIYPSISFNIVISDTFRVIDYVLNQDNELGVVGAKVENGKCAYKYIVTESIILIAPPNTKVTAKNLHEMIYKENFIMREAGSATRYHAGELLKMLNVRPDNLNVIAYLTDTQSTIHAVSKGLGLSIVSEIAARDYIKNNKVTVIKPAAAALTRDFYFVYRKDAILPPQISLYMKYVCDYYAAQPPS